MATFGEKDQSQVGEREAESCEEETERKKERAATSQSSSAQTFTCLKCCRVCESRTGLYSHRRSRNSCPLAFQILVCEESAIIIIIIIKETARVPMKEIITLDVVLIQMLPEKTATTTYKQVITLVGCDCIFNPTVRCLGLGRSSALSGKLSSKQITSFRSQSSRSLCGLCRELSAPLDRNRISPP